MAQPYRVSLDPDTARQLAANGATVLLLDVPAGTVVGVDHQAFAVGPMFKGIKMLPPGVHMVSCQALTAEQSAPVVSFFVALSTRQVLVRRWDAADEGLVELDDQDQVARLAEGVRRFDFDQGLAPYDLSRYGQWQALSSHITPAVVDALMPVGGTISVMNEASDPELLKPKTEAERRLVAQLEEGKQKRAGQIEAMQTEGSAQAQPEPSQAPGEAAPAADRAGDASTSGRCFYTRLPRLLKAPGTTAAALTALNLDKSGLLESVLQGRYAGQPATAILGELQFAFLAFVCGQSLDGYLQWKSLLGLLLGCETAVLDTHQDLFQQFLQVVLAQLQFGFGQQRPNSGDGGAGVAPFGVSLIEELLPDSFLRHLFQEFVEVVHENPERISHSFATQAAELERFLREHLVWDFSIQLLESGADDEYGPVVVDLEEQGV